MAPFGAGLMQVPLSHRDTPSTTSKPASSAYNRWLADLCNANPGRHAGVALINVDDLDRSIAEIEECRKLGLFGGVLLPSSTGNNPFYHHPCYEPLWAVCEDLGMPIQSHSGWSPDYGDVPRCHTHVHQRGRHVGAAPVHGDAVVGRVREAPQPAVRDQRGGLRLDRREAARARVQGRQPDLQALHEGSVAAAERILPAAVLDRSLVHAEARGALPRAVRRRQVPMGVGLSAPRRDVAQHDGLAPRHLQRGCPRTRSARCSASRRCASTTSTATSS